MPATVAVAAPMQLTAAAVEKWSTAAAAAVVAATAGFVAELALAAAAAAAAPILKPRLRPIVELPIAWPVLLHLWML